MENLFKTENQPQSEVEESKAIVHPTGLINKVSNKFGKMAVLGSAMLMHSSSEINKPKESFDQMKERAKKELVTKGITSEQGQTYIKGINDMVYRSIVPREYVESAPTDIETVDSMAARFFAGLVGEERSTNLTDFAREDVWRLYLGMPQ